MRHDQTKTVRIKVSGRDMCEIILDQPATLAEVWRLPQLVGLGPSRMARLGPDGVVYVSVNWESYKAWKLLTELQV